MRTILPPAAALLLLLASPLAAQEGMATDKKPRQRGGSAEGSAAAEPAEIPLDFRKLDKKPSSASGGLVKPGTRMPGGMGPSERSRPSREEPPLPPEPEAEKKEGAESAPRESRRRPDYDLYEEASEAAEWAAKWQVRRYGLPEYYRVGAWQGLRDAIERSLESGYAFDDGAEDGERDPRAARSGSQEGRRAAEELGDQTAREAVEREFRDLAREPRRAPRAPAQLLADEPLPEDLIRVREPRIEDAFGDVAIGSYLHYEGFDRYVDPWQLYGATSWGQVYDSSWDSDRRAFDHWRDRGDDAIWDRLSRPEQDYFRRTFDDQLEYYRYQELRWSKDDAYREGYDDGWDYGADVGRELRYRQGYHQGFVDAATGAAEEVWNELYPEVYAGAYRSEYEAWSTSARPEIAGVELFDQNDDGIFEPGEEVRVALELNNYGGRDARLELGAAGRALAAPAAGGPLALRRRSSAEAELKVKLDPGQAPRTDTAFEVRAGELAEEVPVRISRPLELDRAVTFARLSSLEGRASLEATVWNRSRKPAAGSLDLWVGERRIPGQSLEVLAPGGRRAVALEADGLDGLALLEGAAEVRLELKSREVVQDELVQRLPALGLDLASGELAAFWLEAVYGERDLGRADGVRAVELLARRMAADWEVQRAASGNPYKEDLEKKQARTALGALAAAEAAERRPIRRSDLRKALAARLKALAEKLPGTHPFLRGSFKKLAAKLG